MSWITPSVITLVGVIILRQILDLGLAMFLVKILGALPFRTFFRSAPNNVKGTWRQSWTTDSENFKEATDRCDTVKLSQLHVWVYGEFFAKKQRYVFFGKIKGEYLFIGFISDCCGLTRIFVC